MKRIITFLSKYKYIIIPGLLGILFFIFIYGIDVLDFTNNRWLIENYNDPHQHYFGWEFYRQSPWTFPLGMNQIINYPFDISVIFTDSIPLLAVFFKIFSNILPNYFQYFGMYGLLCFILQGVLSSIILKKFIKDDILVILFSVFFIISPIMIFRMFWHTALASHYIILFGFALILYKDKFNLTKTILLWGLLGVLSGSIHMYFLVFSGMAIVGYALYELLTTRNYKKIIFSFLSYLLCTITTVFILGGFSLPVNIIGLQEIGIFNFNLNGYFNALDGYSKILEKLPLSTTLQKEGFAYLGFGVIISLIISIIYLIVYKIVKKQKININIKLGIVLTFLLFLSIFIASCHKIYFGESLLLEVTFPNWLWQLIGMFRSNGRFSWLGFYIIMIGTFYILSKYINKKILYIVVLVLLAIQIYDMSDILKDKKIVLDNQQYIPILKDERWERLFNENFRNVVFTTEFNSNQEYLTSIYLLALENNKTINRFYIAQGLLIQITDEMVEKLIMEPKDEDIYLIEQDYISKYGDMKLNYYILENIYIATSLKLDYLDEFKLTEED